MRDLILVKTKGTTTMAKRHKDAVEIQEGGACNISGIAHSLIAACKECRDEHVSAREDDAVRLILHQMAYLANVAAIDQGFTEYNSLMERCRAKRDKLTKTDQ